jgi:serine/threonine protein kinase
MLAIKALDKDHIIKNNKTKHVYRERDILTRFNDHPHIIKLVTTF